MAQKNLLPLRIIQRLARHRVLTLLTWNHPDPFPTNPRNPALAGPQYPDPKAPPMVTEHIEDPHEEVVNTATHALATVLSALGGYFLAQRYLHHGSLLFSGLLFCLSLFILYVCSSLYHASRSPVTKAHLRKLDHAAIYLVIASSYSPYCHLAVPAPLGDNIATIVWGLALCGMLFEVLGGLHLSNLSLLLYLGLSWGGLVLAPHLLALPSLWPFALVVLGGLLYTGGTFFYATHHFRYSHAVWHLFVMAASAAHYWAVWELYALL